MRRRHTLPYVQEICDPIFESIKPPGFKKISFRKLQFGDAPIRIESVKMNRTRKEGVFLEMDFRWAGDPDIQLAIDTLGACVPPSHCSLAAIGNNTCCVAYELDGSTTVYNSMTSLFTAAIGAQ